MAPEDSLEELRNRWKDMFQNSLPKAAKSKSSAQKKWPVVLDHCFARIILDKVVGIDAPWTKKIDSPAYKNMSREQLQASIDLGHEILRGDVDLIDLDERSLTLRGKRSKTGSSKRKLEEDMGNERNKGNERPSKKIGLASPHSEVEEKTPSSSDPPSLPPASDLLHEISKSSKTPFQKTVLSLLCQVPAGRYTTYAAISAHLASCPRAVGGALKNNPLAPQVPCHRVLAADGSIGGFKGSWGKNGEAGKNDDKKLKLLRDEGVKFDGKGRAVGTVFTGFVYSS